MAYMQLFIVKIKIFSVHDMKVYFGVRVYFHSVLIQALD